MIVDQLQKWGCFCYWHRVRGFSRIVLWLKKEFLVEQRTQCRRIYGRHLWLIRKHVQNGRILRRSRATSGFVGLFPLRRQRPESSTSKESAVNLKKACEGHVAGRAVCTGKIKN